MLLKDFVNEMEKCEDTDGRFEIICNLAKKCSSSPAIREKFIKENFAVHRKRSLRKYISEGWYFRLIYNYCIRPIKPLGKVIHPDWDDEYFKGRAFWYYYSTNYKGFVEDILDNIDEYRAVWNELADDKSKAVFVGVLKGRLSANKADFIAVMDPLKGQYLDEGVIGHMDREVFADIGGYDGTSTRDFFDYAKGSEAKSYIFEIVHTNADIIRDLFKDDDRVTVIEKGCGDKKETLYYTGSGLAAMLVDYKTDQSAEITTLDDEIREELTYMKMDVEGAESSVLEGAKRHIENDNMRMAVSVYHKPGDYWKLWRQIKGYGIDRKYYLRHYGFGEPDTVLYVV